MSESVRKHFDASASGYRQNFLDKKSGKNFEFRKRAEIVRELTCASSGRLLDCACGTGEITSIVLSSGRFGDATMVDISETMLQMAREQLAKMSYAGSIRFLRSDIFEYEPEPTETFDVILCLGLIAHTGRLAQLLKRVGNWLGDSGILLLQTSVASHPGILLARCLTSKKYFRDKGYEISYFTLPEIDEACSSLGLRVRDVRRYCLGVPFADKVSPSANYWLENLLSGVSSKLGSESILVIERTVQ